ncbi:hypothetical protein [Paenibacillus chitinolyticus]
MMSSNNKMSGGAAAFSPGDSFGSLTNNPNNVTYEPNVGTRALNG